MVLIQAITLFSFFKTLGSCTSKKKNIFKEIKNFAYNDIFLLL